ASLTPSSRTKMSTLCLRCPGNRCNPPAVVPPLWLAFVISKLVRPAFRNFSARSDGYACFELNPKPADKLSPRTRIRFTAEELLGVAKADATVKTSEKPMRRIAVRDCRSDLPIYIPCSLVAEDLLSNRQSPTGKSQFFTYD